MSNNNQIDIAIIGAQKSATTALQLYLHSHPSVFLPLGEVACFESPDFEQGRVARQIDFSQAGATQIHGIKRPTIFSDIIAINRLKDHSPNCKLIMVCREPISRFVSGYFHLMNSGKLPVMEINSAVRHIFRRNYLSLHAAGISLLRNGIYHDALSHIAAVYSRDCLFATSQADIKNDFERVMRELCEFLGVPFAPINASSNREHNVGIYDYRRAFFQKLPNALIYSYSLGRSRKEYRKSHLSRTAGRALSAIFRRWPFSQPEKTSNLLTDESLLLLGEYYSLDRKKLQSDFPEVVYW